MSTEKKEWSRRVFLNRSSQAAAGVVAGMLASSSILEAGSLWPTDSTPRFGLVTYQWGRDWDLPTLLRNCQKAKVWGVELRTEHAHTMSKFSNLGTAQ